MSSGASTAPRLPELAWVRLTPGLLLAVFGLGVLLTEYMHVLMSIRLPPEPVLAAISRYSQGEMPLVLVVVLVAPVAEELLFRGLLLRGLLAFQRPALAVPLAAAIFAAFHFNIWQLLPALCMGLLFGWIYAVTRSLLTCIVGHVAWNAQWWIANDLLGSPVRGYTLEYRPGEFPHQPVWWLAVGGVALCVGLYSLRRQLEVPSAAAP